VTNHLGSHMTNFAAPCTGKIWDPREHCAVQHSSIAMHERETSWKGPALVFHSTIQVTVDAEPPFMPAKTCKLTQALGAAKPRHIAIIGGYAPRRCGIATFTTDTLASLEANFPGIDVDVYPMQPADEQVSFEPPAIMAITENDPTSFARAALTIEESNPDAVWLQHEFGLFGGDAGDCILPLIDAISAPLIVTFHTVLPHPDVNQMRVVRRLIARSSKIVVMSATSMDLMRDVYGASDDQLALIPHGTPDRPFGRAAEFKAKYGLERHRVLMTFGLLSPGKGIENMIAALPAIVARHPDTIYNIVGATHPNLLALEGEAYRESLRQHAEQLGVSANIRWVNAFLDQDELLDQLEAADIYITPYLGAGQATSGTLAYAVALGKAVISTPYVHARELLASDHGILVPFNDSDALSRAITRLLDDPDALNAYQRRAYARGRSTIWSQVSTDTMAMTLLQRMSL
jgi:glycosyltransferase involved in cell wall biosynthesis